ncbi:hypothetical protein B0H16DRAFT_1901427 [Mycena metata]|uniref:DUF6534 domain-containing protein n=1 Tax=Mycena metata TaxID=1033252 RepID=A0AAD7GX48_9AGAR|nr:hypothetical protein B0H16DRAFT_1901427 [Mycena metata]
MPRVEIPGIDVALCNCVYPSLALPKHACSTGPLVLGYMFAFGLYGILIVQVYMYSESFPETDPSSRLSVRNLTLPVTNSYGPGWGDTDTLLTIDWAWGPLPALNGILAGMAQSFYIWRIYSLSKSIYAPIFIALVMLTQVTVPSTMGLLYVMSLAIDSKASHESQVSIEGRGVDKLFALSPEITLWLAGSAACDMLITLSLVWVFSRQKKKTNFSRTSGIINRLIRYSVETGAVTTIGAVIEVTLWLTSRQWNIHFIFFLVIGKLYSNMLMATLNARAPMFRNENGGGGSSNGPSNSYWAENSRPQIANVGLNSRVGGVHISRTTNVAGDGPGDAIVMNDFDSGKLSDKAYTLT